MTNVEHIKYRVAILSTEPGTRTDLKDILEMHHLEVVHNLPLTASVIANLDLSTIDIILLDLDEDAEDEMDLVESLIEQSGTPVLFNDTATTRFLSSRASNRSWGKSLVQKLTQMIGAAKPVPAAPVMPEPDQVTPARPAAPANGNHFAVWVLGASLGGPIACREFFNHVGANLPVSFLVAQHIGANHVELLAQQLNRDSAVQVIPAVVGAGLRKGLAVVAPVDQRLTFDARKQIVFQDRDPHCIYTPSIDHVIGDTIAAYGENVNIIIFSGMGHDGEQGCRLATEHGCQVWAQNSESCIISSMPDHARDTGAVSFSGTPRQLAERLTSLYQD